MASRRGTDFCEPPYFLPHRTFSVNQNDVEDAVKCEPLFFYLQYFVVVVFVLKGTLQAFLLSFMG